MKDSLVSKSWRFTQGDVRAIDLLKGKGYSFPADTQIGVLRKALHEAWSQTFPGKPYPSGDGDDNGLDQD